MKIVKKRDRDKIFKKGLREKIEHKRERNNVRKEGMKGQHTAVGV